MKRIVEIIREALPQTIATLVATAILALIGFVSKNNDREIWLATISVIVLWLICVYFTYARDEPKILRNLPAGHKRPKGPYKYQRIRPLSLRGTYLIPILAIIYLIVNTASYSSKIVILVADFEGPDTQKYRITEIELSASRRISHITAW